MDTCVAGTSSPYSLERLSAFVDGDLPASELQSVRHHLEACAACARHADELAAFARVARALDLPEPPPTLWPAIEGALARRHGGERPEGEGWWASWRPFGVGALAGAAAFAALAFVLTVRGGALTMRGGAPVSPSPSLAPAPTDPLLADAEQELARAASAYEGSIEKLRHLLVREEARWSPEVRARYAERLTLLDDAITRSRETARRAPGESDGHEQLFAAYQQKISFLAEAVQRGGGSGPEAPSP